jgi:chromosome segregation ATPase
MKDETKETIRIVLIMLFAFALLVLGNLGNNAFRESGVANQERAERYEDRSESAQNAVSELESGLSDVAEQMHGVGKEIDEGITDVGELREVGARIAGASSDIEDSACRIEEGIQRIERILYEAEKKDCVLEDCGGGAGSSNSD